MDRLENLDGRVAPAPSAAAPRDADLSNPETRKIFSASRTGSNDASTIEFGKADDLYGQGTANIASSQRQLSNAIEDYRYGDKEYTAQDLQRSVTQLDSGIQKIQDGLKADTQNGVGQQEMSDGLTHLQKAQQAMLDAQRLAQQNQNSGEWSEKDSRQFKEDLRIAQREMASGAHEVEDGGHYAKHTRRRGDHGHHGGNHNPGDGHNPQNPPPGDGQNPQNPPPPGDGHNPQNPPPPGDGQNPQNPPPPGDGHNPQNPPPPGDGHNPQNPPPPGDGQNPQNPPPPGDGQNPQNPPPGGGGGGDQPQQPPRVDVSADVQKTLQDTSAMMGPGGVVRAEKVLEKDVEAARQKYGDKTPEFDSYMTSLTDQLKQSGMDKQLSVAWAKAHEKDYDYIKQDGVLSMNEINLGIQVKDGKDPMASMMLNSLKDNYANLSKEKYDYDMSVTPTFGGQRPLVDGITTNDMNSYLGKQDKQALASWKGQESVGNNPNADVSQTVREAMAIEGPGGIELAQKRIESDMAAAKAKYGDGSAQYKQYLDQLSTEIQRFPNFSQQLSVAWGQQHASDYDYITKDGALSSGELNLAMQITDGKDSFSNLMLSNLKSQYDSLKKLSWDTYNSGSQTTPWGTVVSTNDTLDAISAKDMAAYLSKNDSSLRKSWEKAQDAA